MTEWIQTYTGKRFYPFNPNPDDICIEDIAHALSLQCRFTGHCKTFYSVAQHSVLVSELSGTHKLWGLLHDASEAYLIDVASPVKHSEAFAAYRYAESLVMGAVCKRFGLPPEMPSEVHIADRRALVSEATALMRTGMTGWKIEKDLKGEQHALVNIYPTDWGTAKQMFTNRFEELYGKC